jgi:hypothetical protein
MRQQSTKAIFDWLDEEYDLICTSPQRGYMRLYRLKP